MHEDERRILASVPYLKGELKTIIAKKDSVLGNHYHKIKTEEFKLIKGSAIITIRGNSYKMLQCDSYKVYPNEMHEIEITKDSILTCVCSHTYDHKDDYT